nr:ABC transporter permease [Hyphomicrobiales bacterium]
MTEAITTTPPSRQTFPSFPLSLRLALRELRGGISGFYIFVACIALGATALAAVGTLSSAIEYAISREGRVILGGDFKAELIHRQATASELQMLQNQGEVSKIATLRSMARLPDGSAQALVQLKAVDNAYPLLGQMLFEEEKTLADIREPSAVAVERGLLEQLGVDIGDEIQIGNENVTISAVVAKEPDRLNTGFSLGPRVMMSVETLERTGLAQIGSLIEWEYRIKTADGSVVDQEALEPLSQAGFRFRDRTDPSPSISRQVNRLSEFLALVGLTALLTGGIGVANSVNAFIERKRKVIAAYKALGATGSLITRSFLIQVMVVAMIGILIGLTLGTILPFAALSFFSGVLPLDLEVGLYATPLILSTAYGLLITLIFVLWPLGRTRQIRAGELMRDGGERPLHLPPLAFAAGSVVSAIALTLMAIFMSQQPYIASIAIGAVAGTFIVFAALGFVFQKLAAALPRPRSPELAIALSSIAGPAGLTRTVTLSLGAGLTLLTAIAVTNASMTNELQSQMPERAPSHFFVGINKVDYDRFSQLVSETAPGSELNNAPMLRGKIVSLNGVPASEIDPPEEARWVLNGDRGLTFSDKLPDDSRIVEGEWWEDGYT